MATESRQRMEGQKLFLLLVKVRHHPPAHGWRIGAAHGGGYTATCRCLELECNIRWCICRHVLMGRGKLGSWPLRHTWLHLDIKDQGWPFAIEVFENNDIVGECWC